MLRRKNKKKKVVIGIILGLTGAIIVSCCLGMAMYLMAIYKPAEYAPAPVPVEQQEQAVDQAIALVADIHNNIYASNSFTETVDSELINKLLLHNDLTKLLDREFANSEYNIKYPQISMRDGKLILYVSFSYSSHKAIVSITLEPEITKQGKLVINLASIKSGMLSLPSIAINEYLIAAADKIKVHLDTTNTTAREPNKRNVEKDLGRIIGQTLPELLKKGRVEIDPVINIDQENDKNVRINSITIKDQQATITFVRI